jgi:hypothetical protein
MTRLRETKHDSPREESALSPLSHGDGAPRAITEYGTLRIIARNIRSNAVVG